MTFVEKCVKDAEFKTAFGIVNMLVKLELPCDAEGGRFFVSSVEDTAYLSVNKLNSESISCGMYEACLVYFDSERNDTNYDNQVRLTHDEYISFIKFFVAYAQSQSLLESWDKAYDVICR